MSNQAESEVFPRTQTEFFPEMVQADIIFTKDQDGKSTNLALKQSGLTSTGPKLKQPASRVSRGTGGTFAVGSGT